MILHVIHCILRKCVRKDPFLEAMLRFVNAQMNIISTHKLSADPIQRGLLDIGVESIDLLEGCITVDSNTIWTETDEFP